MKGSFLFLGTGASLGIPVIGCSCKVCTSPSSNNKRLRPSGLIKLAGKSFLLDVGPDFRQQALKYKVNKLDGFILTHVHFDHIAGLDDLRIYYYIQKKKIPCLLSKEDFNELQVRYHYLFKGVEENGMMSAKIDFQLLKNDFGKTDFQGIKIQYMSYHQGKEKVTGYRVGDFAYVTDIREYSEEIFSHLKGLNTLVLSALRHEPSKAHFSVDEAVAFARKVGAKMTYFTHIAHELDHDETNKGLPKDIQLAYDGLEIPFHYEDTHGS